VPFDRLSTGLGPPHRGLLRRTRAVAKCMTARGSETRFARPCADTPIRYTARPVRPIRIS